MWLVEVGGIYGVATGCGCKEYIDILTLLIPTPLVSVLFYSSIPTFCSFKKNVFRSCSSTFLITFYVLNKFFAPYKHTYQQLQASHGIHMKAEHTVLYTKKHIQTSYPAMDISCMSVV